MAAAEKRTISLPAEQASYIDAQVAKGAYASASEVVRAGLRALQERDAAVERWLRADVAPAYDAMRSDPSRAIPDGQVLETIRSRHAKR
jgi:antitoxin ParD1/3/4